MATGATSPPGVTSRLPIRSPGSFTASSADAAMDDPFAATAAGPKGPDVDDAIMVCVRVRPLSERDIGDQHGDDTIEWNMSDTQIVSETAVAKRVYTFDRVFAPTHINADVYDRCARRVVSQALRGYNGTVFAYGQTGSGKTHSMLGTDDDPGILPRAIAHVFDEIESIASSQTHTYTFLVRVSYMEVYNEEINDLLQPIVRGRGRNLRVSCVCVFCAVDVCTTLVWMRRYCVMTLIKEPL